MSLGDKSTLSDLILKTDGDTVCRCNSVCTLCVPKRVCDEGQRQGQSTKKEKQYKSCRNKGKLNGRGDDSDNETRVRMSE